MQIGHQVIGLFNGRKIPGKIIGIYPELRGAIKIQAADRLEYILTPKEVITPMELERRREAERIAKRRARGEVKYADVILRWGEGKKTSGEMAAALVCSKSVASRKMAAATKLGLLL